MVHSLCAGPNLFRFLCCCSFKFSSFFLIVQKVFLITFDSCVVFKALEEDEEETKKRVYIKVKCRA